MAKATAAFDTMKPRDIALAVAASNRIILETLYTIGAEREAVEKAYRVKAQEFVAVQMEENAGNLLRMMSGTVPIRRGA